jgi:hypothetical protein
MRTREIAVRVIRTEMYFDEFMIKSTSQEWQKNPGISAAWLHVPDHESTESGGHSWHSL